MKSLNQVILLGNLGKAPEVKRTPGGKSVALLNLATNKVWKDKAGAKQQSTYWHRVVLWESLADVAKKYLEKGMPVLIQGTLQTRSYDNGGGTVWITEVIANDLVLLSPPKDTALAHHSQDPTEITDDDIPF